MDLINVVCLGDNDAKKTELMCVLTESQCACDEYACVHNKAKDIFTCKLRIKDFPIAYEIRIFNTVDSSSKGLDLDCLRRINYSKAEVMLLVFDLDNPDTLRSIQNKWLNECFEYAKSAKILLVGVESDTTGTHTDIHSIKSDIYTKFHLSYQKVCLESIEDIQGCWLSIIELYDGINRTKKKRRSFVDGFSEIKKKGTRILQKLLPEKQEDQDTEKSKGIHKNHEQESTTWQSELHTIFNKHDSQIFRHFIVDKVLSLRTRDLKALVLALGFDQKALKLPSHLSKSIKKPFWPMLKFWTEQTDDLQITRLPLMYSSLMNIKQKGIANDLLTSVKANYTDDSIRTSKIIRII